MNQKSTGTAYVFLLTMGIFGVHQFYIGNTTRGVGYLLTLGWLGIGCLIDLFTLSSQVRHINDSHALRSVARTAATNTAVPNSQEEFIRQYQTWYEQNYGQYEGQHRS